MPSKKEKEIRISDSIIITGNSTYSLANVAAVRSVSKWEYNDVSLLVATGVLAGVVSVYSYFHDYFLTLSIPRGTTLQTGLNGGTILGLSYLIGKPKKYHYVRLNVGADKEHDILKTRDEEYAKEIGDKVIRAMEGYKVNVRFSGDHDI